ncbi:MAG: hypothetical protein OXE50_13475 [Chloroflexi bacterium]|nr:hypothetical protein [Chloroflexota bacterium]
MPDNPGSLLLFLVIAGVPLLLGVTASCLAIRCFERLTGHARFDPYADDYSMPPANWLRRPRPGRRNTSVHE